MTARTTKQGDVAVVEGGTDDRQATVYHHGRLVATLRRDGSGWRAARILAGVDASGRSVWSVAPDAEPKQLTRTADDAVRLVEAIAAEARAAKEAA